MTPVPDMGKVRRNVTHLPSIYMQQSNSTVKAIWAATWQNQQSDCAPSEDSDQPGHPPSLIRVFAVRMKKAWVLSYPLSAQRRLWSDWANAQIDLSLRWAHSYFVGFVMSRLIYLRYTWQTPSCFSVETETKTTEYTARIMARSFISPTNIKVTVNSPNIRTPQKIVVITLKVMHPKDAEGIANSVDPLGAVWSGSALFAQICLSEKLGKLRVYIEYMRSCLSGPLVRTF